MAGSPPFDKPTKNAAIASNTQVAGVADNVSIDGIGYKAGIGRVLYYAPTLSPLLAYF